MAPWTTVVGCLSLIAYASFAEDTSQLYRVNDVHEGQQIRNMECRISIRDSFSESHKVRGSTVCIPMSSDGVETDDIYDINLSDEFIEKHESEIFSGTLYVQLAEIKVEQGRIYIPDVASVNVVETSNQIRKLSVITGVRTVLVVRVSTTDLQVTLSAQNLSNYIFSNNSITFPSQMDACSFGQLQFVPFQGAEGGVVEIAVNASIANFSDYNVLANETVNELKTLYNVSQITDIGVDHVMICLPPGNWVWNAESVINHWRSVYKDKICASLSYGMKQIGGNLGLRNSGDPQMDEDDYTCYMGRPVPAIGLPQKCFNGDKNSILGWYNNRAMSYNPLVDGPSLVRFAAFVDYDITGPDDIVVAQVGTDLHLQYNRAKSFNSEVSELRDQVTIVQHEYSESILLGGIDLSTFFQLSDYESSGRNLTIRACQTIQGNSTTPDVMVVSIALDSTNLCDPTAAPQPVPTSTPTGGISFTLPTPLSAGLSSSLAPAASGSFLTASPTFAPPPTVSPILRASASSDPPSIAPSLLPSAPAVSVSDGPSQVPSINPSQVPIFDNGTTFIPSFTAYPTKSPSPTFLLNSTISPTITFPSNYTAPPNVTFHPTFSPTSTKAPTMSPTSSAYPTAHGPPSQPTPETNRSNNTQTTQSPSPATATSDVPSLTPTIPGTPTLPPVKPSSPSPTPTGSPLKSVSPSAATPTGSPLKSVSPSAATPTLSPVKSASPSATSTLSPIKSASPSTALTMSPVKSASPSAATSVSPATSTATPTMSPIANAGTVAPSSFNTTTAPSSFNSTKAPLAPPSVSPSPHSDTPSAFPSTLPSQSPAPSFKPTRRYHHRKRKAGKKKKSLKSTKGFFPGNPLDPTVKNPKANKKRDQVLAKVFLFKGPIPKGLKGPKV